MTINVFSLLFTNLDLLSATVVALAKQNMLSAEIEADYMWGLIHPSFLVGDARFHLTTFSSAVAQLKNLRKLTESRTSLHRGSIVRKSVLYVFQLSRFIWLLCLRCWTGAAPHSKDEGRFDCLLHMYHKDFLWW